MVACHLLRRVLRGVSVAAFGAAAAAGGLLVPADSAQAFFWLSQPRYSAPPAAVPGRPARPVEADKPRRKRKLPPVKARLMNAEEKAQYAELLEAAKKGPLLAAISLYDQQLVLYANGEEIARTPISSGTARYPTPTGVFSVIQKNLFHRSNLYSDAPMPYMQRLTWSGVAIHQGILPGYPASHGCIRTPDLFARKFWTMTRLGVRVVVTREAVAPVAFTHAKLFERAPKDDKPPPQASAAAAAPLHFVAGNVQVATAGLTATDAPPSAATPPQASPTSIQYDESKLRPGPMTVFISRKESRLYVRKGFVPLFDVPVVIERPQEPIGTHLLTAMGENGDATSYRWTAVSVPSHRPQGAGAVPPRKGKNAEAPPPEVVLSASDALDRVTVPPEAAEHIRKMMSVGASLMITDHGLGRETGKETDFIVVTR